MTKEFYWKAFNIECIPVYWPHEKAVKICKPSQLVFFERLTRFLKDSDSKGDICSIVSDVIKEYCQLDRVAQTFKDYGGIVLKQLDTVTFLEQLKTFCQRFEVR